MSSLSEGARLAVKHEEKGGERDALLPWTCSSDQKSSAHGLSPPGLAGPTTMLGRSGSIGMSRPRACEKAASELDEAIM